MRYHSIAIVLPLLLTACTAGNSGTGTSSPVSSRIPLQPLSAASLSAASSLGLVSSPSSAISLTSAPSSIDTRTPLTGEALRQANERLTSQPWGSPAQSAAQQEFTLNFQLPATTTVPYRNVTYGFSVDLPYNPGWGNARYLVPPYGEASFQGEQYILDGPLKFSEGGGLGRDPQIAIRPHRSVDAALKDIEAQQRELFRDPLPQDLRPSKTQIGGHNAVKYRQGGLCAHLTIEVVGKNFNYEFSYCGGSDNDAEEFGPLIKVVNTLKLL